MKMNKRLIVLCSLLMLFSIYSFTFSDIVFGHNGTKILSIDDEGNFNPITITENAQETPTNDALLFERNSNLVMWLEESGLFVIGNCTPNPQVPEDGLVFENPQGEIVTALTTDNNLIPKGRAWDLMNAVAYFDGVSVFTKELESNAITLDYLTISSPFEVEGKIKKKTGSDTYAFYLKDHLGSTRAIIGSQGTEEVIQYHAYGMEEEESSMQSSEKVRERFTGKEYDEDGAVGNAPGLGLVYFGARYYDAEIGAWTSTDPAGQFWSPYVYGGGNPIIGIDPNGMLFYTYDDDEEEVARLREAFEDEYYNTGLWEMYQIISKDEETRINEKIWLRAHMEYEKSNQWLWMKEQLDEMYANEKGWKEARASETYGDEWTESFGELWGNSRFTATEKYITYTKNLYNESVDFVVANGTLQPSVNTVCHTFGGQNNMKYTYGPYEAITNDTEPVSEQNKATLNLINSKDKFGHYKYDVKTWIKYGTSEKDPTTPAQRRYKFWIGGAVETIKYDVKPSTKARI